MEFLYLNSNINSRHIHDSDLFLFSVQGMLTFIYLLYFYRIIVNICHRFPIYNYCKNKVWQIFFTTVYVGLLIVDQVWHEHKIATNLKFPKT